MFKSFVGFHFYFKRWNMFSGISRYLFSAERAFQDKCQDNSAYFQPSFKVLNQKVVKGFNNSPFSHWQIANIIFQTTAPAHSSIITTLQVFLFAAPSQSASRGKTHLVRWGWMSPWGTNRPAVMIHNAQLGLPAWQLSISPPKITPATLPNSVHLQDNRCNETYTIITAYTQRFWYCTVTCTEFFS